MKKTYIKVKKSGYIFMVISVLLGIAAVNTGNNLLYMVVSFMLSFMLVSGFIARYNLRNLNVKLIPPADIYAEGSTKFRLIMENGKRFPSFLIRVSIPSVKGKALFLYIGKKSEDEIVLKFPQRGYYEKLNVLLLSDFPVGMFERGKSTEMEVNVLVFPKLLRTDTYIYNDGNVRRDKLGDFEGRGFEDIKDLKPYAGEPAKYIHWKISAKRDELIVREMEGDNNKPIIIEVEKIRGNLEERISKCAYLVEYFIRTGNPVGLKYGNVYIEPALGENHRRKILYQLAIM